LTERERNKAAAERGLPQTFTVGKSASEWRAKQEPMCFGAANAMRNMNKRKRK
jgi:hypothetical protein